MLIFSELLYICLHILYLPFAIYESGLLFNFLYMSISQLDFKLQVQDTKRHLDHNGGLASPLVHLLCLQKRNTHLPETVSLPPFRRCPNATCSLLQSSSYKPRLLRQTSISELRCCLSQHFNTNQEALV